MEATGNQEDSDLGEELPVTDINPQLTKCRPPGRAQRPWPEDGVGAEDNTGLREPRVAPVFLL